MQRFQDCCGKAKERPAEAPESCPVSFMLKIAATCGEFDGKFRFLFAGCCDTVCDHREHAEVLCVEFDTAKFQALASYVVSGTFYSAPGFFGLEGIRCAVKEADFLRRQSCFQLVP